MLFTESQVDKSSLQEMCVQDNVTLSSYLESGLKLTFVPWSKSTFARTYLRVEQKKLFLKYDV